MLLIVYTAGNIFLCQHSYNIGVIFCQRGDSFVFLVSPGYATASDRLYAFTFFFVFFAFFSSHTKHGLKTSMRSNSFYKKSLCFLTNKIPVFNQCFVLVSKAKRMHEMHKVARRPPPLRNVLRKQTCKVHVRTRPHLLSTTSWWR
jgi:hypothetical protein